MLKSNMFQQDSQIYYETDPADSIFFLVKGAAGFVLPFRRNIVYVEVDTGDEIGQEDLVEFSQENEIQF
jgi:signal-transduction protein with cAMP-binding, CBS, and nucleotidyltransferase domain